MQNKLFYQIENEDRFVFIHLKIKVSLSLILSLEAVYVLDYCYKSVPGGENSVFTQEGPSSIDSLYDIAQANVDDDIKSLLAAYISSL